MRSSFRFSNGVQRETKTRFGTGSAAVRRSNTLTANDGESLGSITLRAYGANTPELRNRIVNANASLSGEIVVPH